MFVSVTSHARLHLGFYNILSDGVAYGSIGVAIDHPVTSVSVRDAESSRVVNVSGVYVDDVINEVLSRFNDVAVELRIEEAIPRHVGLGSTTQLVLSTGCALSKILGTPCDARKLALIFRRGRISGIGIAAFERGGFIVDSGRRVRDGVIEEPKSINDIPQVIFRHPLPRSWCFIVVIPKGVRGLDERAEREFLDVPYEPPEELQDELRRTLILHLLPSITRRDAEVFGKSITRIQELVGRYFSRYQGGIYCCDETECAVRSLLRNGAYGAGQSSWGPTAYGVVCGYRRALKVLEGVKRDLSRRGIEAAYYIVRAKNRGATVRVESS